MRARAEAPRSRAADTPTRMALPELPRRRPWLSPRPEPGASCLTHLLLLPDPACVRPGSYMAYDDAVLPPWLPAVLLLGLMGRCFSEGKKLALKFAAQACFCRALGGTGLEQLLRLAPP